MAKIFALVVVGDLDLQNRTGKNFQSIKQGNRRMGKGCRVDHDSGSAVTIIMNSIYQRPLVIRLEPRGFKAQFLRQRLTSAGNVVQRVMAANVRFPPAETV